MSVQFVLSFVSFAATDRAFEFLFVGVGELVEFEGLFLGEEFFAVGVVAEEDGGLGWFGFGFLLFLGFGASFFIFRFFRYFSHVIRGRKI